MNSERLITAQDIHNLKLKAVTIGGDADMVHRSLCKACNKRFKSIELIESLKDSGYTLDDFGTMGELCSSPFTGKVRYVLGSVVVVIDETIEKVGADGVGRKINVKCNLTIWTDIDKQKVSDIIEKEKHIKADELLYSGVAPKIGVTVSEGVYTRYYEIEPQVDTSIYFIDKNGLNIEIELCKYKEIISIINKIFNREKDRIQSECAFNGINIIDNSGLSIREVTEGVNK